MKAIGVILTGIIISSAGSAFALPIPYSISGTINYLTGSSAELPFKLGDEFTATLTYDYDAASQIIDPSSPSTLYFINSTLQLELTLNGYTTTLNSNWYLLSKSFYRTPSGTTFSSENGLDSIYYEDAYVHFDYGDGINHDGTPYPTLPNPESFALTQIDLISGVDFYTMHLQVDQYSSNPVSPAPEPGTLLLMGTALGAYFGFYRKTRRHHNAQK